MIVSIPETITHQELERKLFLKKTYGEVLNLKLKAIIARERLLSLNHIIDPVRLQLIVQIRKRYG
jgi:hypothetical protein